MPILLKTAKNIYFYTFCSLFYSYAAPASPQQNDIIFKSDKATFDYSKSLTGKAKSQSLQGGISLSRTLPPAPKSLHKGAIFKETNIPKTAKSKGWYWIPSWLAGKWHRETFTSIESDGKTQTYTERANHLWGHQADCFGNIWHHHDEPYIQIVEQSSSIFFKTITLQKPITATANKIFIRYEDITVEFNKNTRTIINTFQHEQVSELSKQGDLLYEEVWDRNFDEKGKCTDSGHAKTTYTLISHFHPLDIDKKTGLNLKKDFALYLTTHGLSARLPNQ